MKKLNIGGMFHHVEMRERKYSGEKEIESNICKVCRLDATRILTGQKSVFSCKSKERNGKYKIHTLFKPAKAKLFRYIKIKGEATPFDPAYQEYFERRKLLSNTVAI